jgi:hypothetical protein
MECPLLLWSRGHYPPEEFTGGLRGQEDGRYQSPVGLLLVTNKTGHFIVGTRVTGQKYLTTVLTTQRPRCYLSVIFRLLRP